jgi:hypothetical protein
MQAESSQINFLLKPGKGSSAMFNLETTLKDTTNVYHTRLTKIGWLPGTFGIVSGCPEGKMKTGADILCHLCPYPQFTNDSKTCKDCPEGQVPTDKVSSDDKQQSASLYCILATRL